MIDYDLLPPTPTDTVLKAVEETLAAFPWADFGLADLVVRQARNQYAAPDQMPCITIRWTADEPREQDQRENFLTPWEMGVDMSLVLEIDVELEADDDEIAQRKDPTGMKLPTAIAALSLRALNAEDARVKDFADSVSDRGRGQDPDSTADNVRLEQSVGVLYRVQTEDPSVLLGKGVNG